MLTGIDCPRGGGSPLPPAAGEVAERSDAGEGLACDTLTRRAVRGDLSRKRERGQLKQAVPITMKPR